MLLRETLSQKTKKTEEQGCGLVGGAGVWLSRKVSTGCEGPLGNYPPSEVGPQGPKSTFIAALKKRQAEPTSAGEDVSGKQVHRQFTSYSLALWGLTSHSLSTT